MLESIFSKITRLTTLSWLRYSVKNTFLKSSHRAHKNTCVEVSFWYNCRPAILLKNRLRNRYFSVNFAKVLKTPFLQKISPRLLQSKIAIAIVKKPLPMPAGIYLFKVNNRNTRTGCEICSKLTINTPERRQWRRSGVFIVKFEHISHLVLVFLLLTLSR